MGDELKAVLVGCGGISTAWLDPVTKMQDVRLVGLVDIVEEAARKRAEQYGLQDAVTGTDLRTVLRDTDPDIVFNCTIPEAHLEVTLTALGHGCHVLSEKPMADSMENARRMVEAAEESGKLFAVMQNRRYAEPIRRLRAFLEWGQVGPLTTLNSDFYIGAHFGGFRDHMPHVLLLDMAIHTFDAARFISGADPVAVYCHEWNPAGSWYDRDASAVAVFEMTGGLVYTYRGSWCAEGLQTSWEAEWRAIGPGGSVLWDGHEGFRSQVVAETGGFQSKYADVALPPHDAQGETGGHGGLIRDFVGYVREGRTPGTVCTDNIKSLAMVFGAIESAETGRRVEIEA
ncbi:MAG: Gfo/Idh/MocA family oxidoreductase [Chloroflexota bacterium]|nr:Gfo/Idh/MocA family oxidoreductase [Chloroflexota bacterium]